MWALAGVCSACARVGTASAATARRVSVEITRGASASKRCVPCFSPPIRKASPRTSRLLARIDPTSAACTTVTRPARSAKIETKSSGRLPSPDWRTPVAPGPSRSPNCWVASPTTEASTASAAAVTTKTRTALARLRLRRPARALAASAAIRVIHSLRRSALMSPSLRASVGPPASVARRPGPPVTQPRAARMVSYGPPRVALVGAVGLNGARGGKIAGRSATCPCRVGRPSAFRALP